MLLSVFSSKTAEFVDIDIAQMVIIATTVSLILCIAGSLLHTRYSKTPFSPSQLFRNVKESDRYSKG